MSRPHSTKIDLAREIPTYSVCGTVLGSSSSPTGQTSPSKPLNRATVSSVTPGLLVFSMPFQQRPDGGKLAVKHSRNFTFHPVRNQNNDRRTWIFSTVKSLASNSWIFFACLGKLGAKIWTSSPSKSGGSINGPL